MKHVGKVSVVRDWTAGGGVQDRSGAALGFADSKSDYKEVVSQASIDFKMQKKNEIPL